MTKVPIPLPIQPPAVHLYDADKLYLGTSNDVSIEWDGTNCVITALTDDSVIEVGDAATTQKSFDLKWYGGAASGASYLYADASANLIYTTGVDLQFKDSDYLVFGTGSGATGDVQMTWDGTNLLVTATADDSLIEIGDSAATQKSFDVKVYGDAANGADYLLWDASASTLFGVGAVNVALGVSGTPLVDDTADTKFVSIYADCGASSGDARGIYDRLYITGTGSGEALRAMTSVGAASAATGGTINGAHISLDIDASASISGQAFAARFTYGANDDTKTLNSNNSVVFLESDLGTGITAGAKNAFIRIGDNTAQRLSNLFRLPDASNGTLLATHDTDSMTHSLKCVTDDGTTVYVMCTTTGTNRD